MSQFLYRATIVLMYHCHWFYLLKVASIATNGSLLAVPVCIGYITLLKLTESSHGPVFIVTVH